MNVLACPHCGTALQVTDSAARCINNHSFDRAREGYFNLLPGGRLASSTTPGDTSESLAARRRFLNSGGYSPIAEHLARAVGDVNGAILDVGCGEGYYTSHLHGRTRVGIDISKRAVQMAAKRLPGDLFAVASAYRLPILDASCAAVVSVFSPHPLDEFRRVLQPGGRWFTVTPAANHLSEMRPNYSPDAAAHSRFEKRAQPPEGAEDAERVTFPLSLTDETASDLFTMTPLQWQSGADGTTVREVTVDVWVSSGSAWRVDRKAEFQ